MQLGGECLKYMNQNKRSDSWAIIQIEKPAAQIKFQFEFALFISQVDYWNEEWNQYSMNEFISPLMK